MSNVDRRLTKNEKRRQRKKSGPSQITSNNFAKPHNTGEDLEGVEIEYVAPDPRDFGADDALFSQFKEVFDKFAKPEELLSDKPRFLDTQVDQAEFRESKENFENHENLQITEAKKLSKKKKKLLSRLSVSELKQLVPRPDVVEAHDVTSSDPKLLIHLKAYRNSVPVPRHWCHVRKYLQGKRGIEKIPFQLPEYIAETGIAKIRETVLEQEAMKKGKQKAREKIRPKMGKIDIDYQVLHDAFFKYQTKPKMSSHGDLYYEGKEFEVQAKEKKPGMLSQDLIAALGMQEGSPPPWLINMQRYGPPPSYPNLRIPGLNAPLPPGAAYGYQPGGWGKPPVDEYGRPLYGDVFGVSSTNEVDTGPIVDKEFRWGGFEIEEINEFEEEEDDNEDEDEEEDQEGNRSASTRTVIDQSGLDTPSTLDGTASMISGMETPAVIDLRKRAGTETPDTHSSQRELFQVIQEKKGSALAGGQLFGSDRTYVMNNNKADVHMSLNPDDIDEVIKDKDKLKDAHESYQQDGMFKHMNNFSTDGIESEEDKSRGSKKRKAEQQPVISRKMKEFKF